MDVRFLLLFPFLILTLNNAVIRKCEACSGVNMVSRKAWGARLPEKSATVPIPPVEHVFIHHTVSGQCSTVASCSGLLKGFQNQHMNIQKWGDIGYSFLIGGDGKVYEGRGWSFEGAHTIGYNRKGIGISFIGDFTKITPSASMLKAAQALISCGLNSGKIKSAYQLHGHRDAYSTTCPGDKLYAIIKTWKNYRKIK